MLKAWYVIESYHFLTYFEKKFSENFMFLWFFWKKKSDYFCMLYVHSHKKMVSAYFGINEKRGSLRGVEWVHCLFL